MTVRSIARVCVVLVAASLMYSSTGRTAEKKQKVTKDQILGAWLHTPGDSPAFTFKEDGSGPLQGGTRHGGVRPCQWAFNEHYQMLVIKTSQLRRQYKVRIEEGGKVLLYDGREDYR